MNMKEIKIEKHKNNIVAKSNELIKAKGSLSGTAQKMLASVISMLKTDDTEFQQYALKIDDYLELIGSKSNNKNFLMEQAKELMRNPFEVDRKLFNWCSMVDLGKIEGYIVFDIHQELKPYLLQLKERGNFTQYKIINILSLRGEYSPRLYEYFVMEFNQQRKYQKVCVLTLKIDDLRSFLQIPKSYRYNHIKTRIIEKAEKDFKDHTDIKFTYIEKKIGRKVDQLIITITENNRDKNNYLSSQQAFISYIRKNFVNKKLLEGIDKDTKKKIIISVTPDGKIYDLYQNTNFNATKSLKMWELLHTRAKEGKLDLNI